MAFNTPFFRGKDVALKLYQDGKTIVIQAKNFNVEENAVEAADPVCGEDRDRLDKVTNFFSGSVDIYQSDVSVLNKIIDAQKPDDAAALPLNQSGAVYVKMRDGTRAVFLMKQMKLGPFGFNIAGRTDDAMVNLKFRFRYWEPASTTI